MFSLLPSSSVKSAVAKNCLETRSSRTILAISEALSWRRLPAWATSGTASRARHAVRRLSDPQQGACNSASRPKRRPRRPLRAMARYIRGPLENRSTVLTNNAHTVDIIHQYSSYINDEYKQTIQSYEVIS